MPFIRDIQVAGLIANRPIGELTTHEIAAAFRRCGWVERSYTDTPHFFQQLRKDGPTVGIKTLGDFARAMRHGTSEQGEHGRVLRVIPGGRGAAVVEESAGSLITFTHRR